MMFGKPDHTFFEMTQKSATQWLEQQTQSDDLVNEHGAKLTLEYIQLLQRHIKELEDKNALKDEFLKKMKQKCTTHPLEN